MTDKKRLEETISQMRDEITSALADRYRDLDFTKGKKLRGILTVLVSECLGGDHNKAIAYGSAVELVHQGSIYHDDVIDQHTERRGDKPLYLVKGIKKALLMGDIMFSGATKIAAEHGGKEANEIATAMERVLKGVLTELSIEKSLQQIITGKVEENLYYKIIDLKTAALFACAAKFGAMTATDKESIQNEAFRYGMYLGEAYQIADDLVDISRMADGELDITPQNLIPLIPAVVRYNHEYLKRIPLKVLTGRIGIDEIFTMVGELDMTGKMLDDITHLLEQVDMSIEELKEAASTDVECTLKEYSRYCVNMMLKEVGESV